MSVPLDDTIAAIATAAGTGGVGIIRLSGPRAIEIAAAALSLAPALLDRNVRVGWLRDSAGTWPIFFSVCHATAYP